MAYVCSYLFRAGGLACSHFEIYPHQNGWSSEEDIVLDIVIFISVGLKSNGLCKLVADRARQYVCHWKVIKAIHHFPPYFFLLGRINILLLLPIHLKV